MRDACFESENPARKALLNLDYSNNSQQCLQSVVQNDVQNGPYS